MASGLTERDRALVRFVGQHELASGAQLWARFWAGRGERTAQERLAQLERAGVLRVRAWEGRPGTACKVYQVTKKGQAALGGEATVYTEQVLRREVAEILSGVAVHAWLEQQGYTVEQWVSGRELDREQGRELLKAGRGRVRGRQVAAIADGQALVSRADYPAAWVAIEIDGQYWGAVLAEKLAGFGRSGLPVVYAVTEQRRLSLVQAAAQPYANVAVIAL